MCRIYSEAALLEGGHVGSIGSEAQKSRSRRCHGREQLVELSWYPGRCAEGTFGVHFVAEGTLPHSIWLAPWRCLGHLGHSVELWITKGAEIQVSSELETSSEQHYFEAPPLLVLDIQEDVDAELGALYSEEEEPWYPNRRREWYTLDFIIYF